jgi:ELWxxDGT repeat protein
MLVSDINQLPDDSNVHNLTNLDGKLYFAATNGTHGIQLWKSDGTADGTVMVTDINPGVGAAGGFDPRNLTPIGQTLFFTANDGVHGYELWKSDGTSDGTSMVKDLVAGAGSSNPTSLTNVNGTLFFEANNGTAFRVYMSDGTADGTVEIAGSYPPDALSGLTAAQNSLYFITRDPNGINFGSSIVWRTEGTTAQRLTTVEQPSSLSAVNDALFYSESIPFGGGFNLYRTDSAGTATLRGYYAQAGANLNGTYVFADNITHALWKSDGTTAGTVRITNFSGNASAQNFITANDTLYFTVYGSSGAAVWKSDGTSAGTTPFASSSAGGPVGPRQFTTVDGELYFEDADLARGYSLWKSDGTTDGTIRVADHLVTSTDFQDAGLSPLTAAGGNIYFVVDNATQDSFHNVVHDRQLWKSDGTAAGTAQFNATITAKTKSSSPHDLFKYGNSLFFTANDGVHGDQLYTTDGTAAATTALTNITGGTTAHDPVNLNGTLYFSANDGVHGDLLWQSDGTPGGTTAIVGAPGGRFLTIFHGLIFYSGYQMGHGSQLWKSDGTAAGTAQITDINPSSRGFDISEITVFNDAIYFSANDGSNGYQLWTSDGTTAGTVMLTNISSPGGIYPRLLTEVNGTLFFEVIINNSIQLWKSNGTAAGTVEVAEVFRINVVNTGWEITSVNNTLFFTINENNGIRLWKSDGTTSGTISLGFMPSISNLVTYQGTLYFAGMNAAHGSQLWKTDGTLAGTVMVTDFNPTHGGLGIRALAVADGRLLFSGNDGVNGQELWVSDGTAAGTSMVADINPGPAGSNPANFKVVNGVVYFTADDGTHGVELWKAGAVTSSIRILTDSNATAGTPFTVTVQALNDFGGIDPNYHGTVDFTSSDPRASLPADYAFTADDAGSHVFTDVTLFKAGSQELTVSDLASTELTATYSILVKAASVASFDVVAAEPVYALVPFDLTVTALDAYGNVVTDYLGLVSIQSFFNTDDLPDSYAFTSDDAGSHTFSVTAVQEGQLLLVFADLVASASGSSLIQVQGTP